MNAEAIILFLLYQGNSTKTFEMGNILIHTDTFTTFAPPLRKGSKEYG